MAQIHIAHPVNGKTAYIGKNGVLVIVGHTPLIADGLKLTMTDQANKAVPTRLILGPGEVVTSKGTSLHHWLAIVDNLQPGQTYRMKGEATIGTRVKKHEISFTTARKPAPAKPKKSAKRTLNQGAAGLDVLYPLPDSAGDPISFCPYSFIAVGDVDTTDGDSMMVAATMNDGTATGPQNADYLDSGSGTGTWVAAFYSLVIQDPSPLFTFYGYGDADPTTPNPNYEIDGLTPDEDDC